MAEIDGTSILEVEGPSGSKRRREADLDEGPTPPQNTKSGGSGKGMGAGGSGAGGALMPIPCSIAIKNSYPEVFTQRFRFALPNVNWVRELKPNGEGRVAYTQVPYFYFPLQRLPFYMNIAEWAQLKGAKRVIRCKSISSQFRYCNFRPIYTTGETSVQIASNQNLPQFEIWRNFRNIKPYLVFSNDGNSETSVGQYMTLQGTAGTSTLLTLSERLYGDQIEQSPSTLGVGAVDGVRGYSLRPTFINNGTSADDTNIQRLQSGLNLLKHRSEMFNAQAINTSWNWSYKPKNGLMWVAPTSMRHMPPELWNANPALAAVMAKADRGVNTFALSGNDPSTGATYTVGQISGPKLNVNAILTG